MNFLGHLYLSRNLPGEIIAGNFVADALKSKELKAMPSSVLQGVRLHRNIDEFTDKNAWVRKSKQRLYPEYGKYASVIVDIFYDHILAKEWERYAPDIALKDFAELCYKIPENHPQVLTEHVRFLLTHMKNQNWLYNYFYIEGLERTFNGMSKRASFNSGMETACIALGRDYEMFREEFNGFFPEIIAYVENIDWQRSDLVK